MEDTLYLSNRVRAIRQRLGMRQQDLADQVGVSRQTIIAIERGRNPNPSVHTAILISRVLREPVDYVFFLSHTKEKNHAEPATRSAIQGHAMTAQGATAEKASSDKWSVVAGEDTSQNAPNTGHPAASSRNNSDQAHAPDDPGPSSVFDMPD